MRVTALAACVITLYAPTARAQAGTLSADVKTDYRTVRDFVIRAADKMPDTDYAFKPTPDVRSFAEQIAHIADDQYNLCAPARQQTRQAEYRDIEKRLSRKSDLVPALKMAFAYCDVAYDDLTDTGGTRSTSTGRNVFSMLNWNLWHTWEHYGNLVVYLRVKGLVPPSSEPRGR